MGIMDGSDIDFMEADIKEKQREKIMKLERSTRMEIIRNLKDLILDLEDNVVNRIKLDISYDANNVRNTIIYPPTKDKV